MINDADVGVKYTHNAPGQIVLSVTFPLSAPRCFLSPPLTVPSPSHCTAPALMNTRMIPGTAILDVLIPPYDESSGRDCTYYRAEQRAGAEVNLIRCSPGDSFRVVRGYSVPPFLT